MTESTEPCPDTDRLVALALGELAGRERAEVLTHLVACRRCRDEVDGLVDVTEQLLLAAPEAEPPAGFENAVLDRMRPERRDRRRPARRVAIVAAAAVLVFATALGVLIGTRDASNLAEASMITPTGHDVGSVWRYDGDRSWLFVSVPGWTVWDEPDGSAREYRLRAELDDGTPVDLGQIQFGGRDGSWGTTTDLDVTHLRTVSVVDDTGHVWCTGEF